MSEIIEFLKVGISGKIGVDEQVEYLSKFQIEAVDAVMLAAAAKFLLDILPDKPVMPGAIDICGTGGSGLARINTSTISAFLLAQMGVKVAKHGNNAASGRFGSFDLLQKMGINTDLDKARLEELFKDENLAFIYARKFYPVMKNFAEARAKYGKPTVFNLLGPLINPAMPKKQVIGTAFRGKMQVLAEACHMLGKTHVLVVHGDGLDEVSISGKTDVVELKNGKIAKYTISAEDFGISACKYEECSGGDEEFNLEIARKILAGKCTSRHKDLVYVNSSLAMVLAGRAENYQDGFRKISKIKSEKHISYKKLAAKNANILDKIVSGKNFQPSYRDFYGSLRKKDVSVIAEIKKASPSGGIIRDDFDPVEIAKIYENNGANAISVLTDEKFFQGSFEYLREVRKVTDLPLLCKDFIVSEYQIYKAREYGADAVLLIAGILSAGKLRNFRKLAESLGMDALVEVHNEKELKKSLASGAEIIGINNRNLKDFKIDLSTTERLSGLIPEGKLIVSESGISEPSDLKKLPKNINAVLVGSALMKSQNISQKLYELTNIA